MRPRQQLKQERLRDLRRDVQCRVNQFFSASVRVPPRIVHHCVRESGGRCIRRDNLQPERVPWAWAQACLRDQLVQEADRELRPAGLGSDMFRAV